MTKVEVSPYKKQFALYLDDTFLGITSNKLTGQAVAGIISQAVSDAYDDGYTDGHGQGYDEGVSDAQMDGV